MLLDGEPSFEVTFDPNVKDSWLTAIGWGVALDWTKTKGGTLFDILFGTSPQTRES